MERRSRLPKRNSRTERQSAGAVSLLYTATGIALLGCAVIGICCWLETLESLYLLLAVVFLFGAVAIVLERPHEGSATSRERKFGIAALGAGLCGLGALTSLSFFSSGEGASTQDYIPVIGGTVCLLILLVVAFAQHSGDGDAD